MSYLLIALTAAMLAATPAEPPVAPAKNAPASKKEAAPKWEAAEPEDPVEMEYMRILLLDDQAQADADRWIKEAEAFSKQGAGTPQATLLAKVEQRFQPVRNAYEEFIKKYPKHARARVAYGSFLNDIHEEEAAVEQWEKAREVDPSLPAAWNNLANHYGHNGPVTKSFEYYERAIELAPKESVYRQNLATTVYLFRKDAMAYYKITEKEVFERSLDHYRKAVELDPENFQLATDYAQSYYGIKPLRTADALKAWNYALKLSVDDLEREGVYVHLARVEMNSGMFEEASRHLNSITNALYATIKERLERNLVQRKEKGASTNAPNTDLDLPPNGSAPVTKP